MAEESQPIPQTLEEAVEFLLARLGPEAWRWLQPIPESDLDDETWSLAAQIRKDFDLWGSSPLTAPQDEFDDYLCEPHPDDVSAEIVFQAWQRLRNGNA